MFAPPSSGVPYLRTHAHPRRGERKYHFAARHGRPNHLTHQDQRPDCEEAGDGGDVHCVRVLPAAHRGRHHQPGQPIFGNDGAGCVFACHPRIRPRTGCAKHPPRRREMPAATPPHPSLRCAGCGVLLRCETPPNMPLPPTPASRANVREHDVGRGWLDLGPDAGAVQDDAEQGVPPAAPAARGGVLQSNQPRGVGRRACWPTCT